MKESTRGVCSFPAALLFFSLSVCGGFASDLVLHYSFNTDDGGIVYDQSGLGNNGSVSGASFAASSCGGAYEFDGVDDSIFVPQSASLSVTGSLTLAAWMKVYNYNRQRPILEWNTTGTSGAHMWTGVWGWQWGGKGTGANLVDITGNENSYVVSTANPPANQWQHLAVTYDRSAGVGRVYINGVLKAEKQLGIFTPKTALDLYIGKRPGQAEDPFYGMLDEIRVYNGALASNEVLALCLASTNCEPTYGAATCAIEPAAAVSEGAQWRLTSGAQTNWNDSGAVVSNLTAGSYTVSFKTVADWTEPISRVIQVSIGQIAQASGTYVRSTALTNTLVLHYNFDTNLGGVVTDLSGFGNNASVSGATYVATACGGAYEFDGSNDFLFVPRSASLNIADSMTLAAWFKVYNYSRQRPIMEWNTTNGISGTHMWTGVSAWKTGANFVDTATNTHSIGTPNPLTNVWHHLAVTYDRNTGVACVYLDGVLKNQLSKGVFVPKTDVDLYIGMRPKQPTDMMYGLLDELRVYKGSLSSNEINSLYSQQAACMQPAGNVTCTIQPTDARAAGAQWRLTNGADTEWKTSGASIMNLPVGNYGLAFKPLTGWNTPATQTLSVANGQAVSVTGTYASAGAPSNTLVLHYNFNGDAGASVTDQSGHGNHGSVSGATYVALDCGGAYDFDGSNDFLFVPRSSTLNIAGSLTMAAWVRVHDYEHQRPIMEWNDTNGISGVHLWTGVWGWQWGGKGTGANLVDVTGNENSYLVSTANPPVNQWHHIAVTYDQGLGVARVYVDGQAAAERTLGVFTPDTTRDLYIGYRPRQPTDMFSGLMDEIRVYSGALSAGEVLALFQSTSDCEPTMGSVSCSISPPEACAAGAQWRLTDGDQTNWSDSGATLVNLDEGANTVTFKALPGWNQPVNQPLTVVRGSNLVVSATYSPVLVDTAPPVIVSIFPPTDYVTTSNELFMTIVVTDNTAVASVKVNNKAATGAGDVYTYYATGIRKSYNAFTILAADVAGNTASQTINYAQARTLQLNSMWDGYWRVRNPFSSNVDYTWEWINTTNVETGAGTAPANSDCYFTSSSGHKVIRLMVNGEQVDVANSNPTPPNPEELRAGSLDSDGDGFSNYDEELAGTDISNSNSIFGVAGGGRATPGMERMLLGDGDSGIPLLVLCWTSSVDNVYSIAASADMESWYFIPEFKSVSGTGQLMYFTNSLTSEPDVFLRISAGKKP